MHYTALVKIVIAYAPGNTPSEQVVTKVYDNPNDYIVGVDDLTAALNERLATDRNEFGDVLHYTITQKVNGKLLDVEHVSYDARFNFVVRNTPKGLDTV